MQQNNSSRDQLNTRVALYTAIAGTLFTGAAMANPTLSSVSGLSVTVDDQGSSQDRQIDIDGDGEIDFYFYTWFSTGECDYSPGNSYLTGVYNTGSEMLTDDDGYGGMISAGSVVPGGMSPVDYNLNLIACDLATEFAPNQMGYAGFQLGINGNTHYGYMRIGTSESETDLTTTFHEVCYESNPDTPIRAGACGTTRGVPVGGLIPLSLGVLATGAFALRRRRKHLN